MILPAADHHRSVYWMWRGDHGTLSLCNTSLVIGYVRKEIAIATKEDTKAKNEKTPLLSLSLPIIFVFFFKKRKKDDMRIDGPSGLREAKRPVYGCVFVESSQRKIGVWGLFKPSEKASMHQVQWFYRINNAGSVFFGKKV